MTDTAWRSFTCRNAYGEPFTVRVRRRGPTATCWLFRSMPTGYSPREQRDRLNAASQNLGYGPIPAVEIDTRNAESRTDLGIFLAIWHPDLLAEWAQTLDDPPEVIGELGLDGTVRPVIVRTTTHPPLPWTR